MKKLYSAKEHSLRFWEQLPSDDKRIGDRFDKTFHRRFLPFDTKVLRPTLKERTRVKE